MFFLRFSKFFQIFPKSFPNFPDILFGPMWKLFGTSYRTFFLMILVFKLIQEIRRIITLIISTIQKCNPTQLRRPKSEHLVLCIPRNYLGSWNPNKILLFILTNIVSIFVFQISINFSLVLSAGWGSNQQRFLEGCPSWQEKSLEENWRQVYHGPTLWWAIGEKTLARS